MTNNEIIKQVKKLDSLMRKIKSYQINEYGQRMNSWRYNNWLKEADNIAHQFVNMELWQ